MVIQKNWETFLWQIRIRWFAPNTIVYIDTSIKPTGSIVSNYDFCYLDEGIHKPVLINNSVLEVRFKFDVLLICFIRSEAIVLKEKQTNAYPTLYFWYVILSLPQ